MKFSVQKTNTGNSLLNMANKDAAYRQSDTEHDEALALDKTGTLEKQLVKYWNDQEPRRDLQLGSSFIEGVEYDPYTKNTTITIDGNRYDFPQISEYEVGDMVTSPSIGQWLWDHGYLNIENNKEYT